MTMHIDIPFLNLNIISYIVEISPAHQMLLNHVILSMQGESFWSNLQKEVLLFVGIEKSHDDV